MAVISALVIFFFLLVTVFPLVCLALAVSAWAARRLGQGRPTGAGLNRRRLACRTDRLKQSAFVVSVVVLFFLVTPFALLVFVVGAF